MLRLFEKSSNRDASELIRIRKDKVLACDNDVYSQSKNKKVCSVKKNMCCCNSTDKVGYTRINHNWCTTTKAILKIALLENRLPETEPLLVMSVFVLQRPTHRRAYRAMWNDKMGYKSIFFNNTTW